MKKIARAINWNKIEDSNYEIFWNQNVRQFWVDEEIPVSEDRKDWNSGKLNATERDVYEKVLAGLTLLDTEQATTGMANIVLNVNDDHAKAVFSFMGAMEQMHAKSYSTIFSTLATTNRIDELFNWVEDNVFLQKKVAIINKYYNNITDEKSMYQALVASVMLETFLFYSGFFYPLYCAGKGMMLHSGEMISLIIRDEAVHGIFTGFIAQKYYRNFDATTQAKLKQEVIDMIAELYDNEIAYTKSLYDEIGLTEDVINYVQYNVDKALMNIGFDPLFNISEEKVNPIVMNGINTTTKNHDFFSTKGNGYIKPTNIVPISDSDFDI